jgi:hypothetical protein
MRAADQGLIPRRDASQFPHPVLSGLFELLDDLCDSGRGKVRRGDFALTVPPSAALPLHQAFLIIVAVLGATRIKVAANGLEGGPDHGLVAWLVSHVWLSHVRSTYQDGRPA